MMETLTPTSDVLERITINSKGHPERIYTRLFRYLLREDVYYAAFQNLYANKGAMTPGTDESTADGFSAEYVQEIIESLRNGTYKATPVRRVYIPKKNGKMRPLGIPSFRDKLVQEVVRMFLEAIYEPNFSDSSHGFRPNRSCHTAFKQIKYQFRGVPWIIEGDIKACFDDINHDILMELLGKKIKDRRFLHVIRKFLKAGYIDDWRYYETYSGCPQGGIISPIMANIYLSELDKKVEEIKGRFEAQGTETKSVNSMSGTKTPEDASEGETTKHATPTEKPPVRNKPRVTKEYRDVSNSCTQLKKLIGRFPKGAQRDGLIADLHAQQKKLRTIQCTSHDDKKIVYVRYADDWIIGVKGTKEECRRIKEEIKTFLKKELDLTLSEEKTLITHSSDKVRFLGYDISVRRTRQRRGYRSKSGKKIARRTLSGSVNLEVPLEDKITAYLFKKGAIIQTPDGKIRPRHRKELLGKPDHEIVKTYNSEIRGLLNFYGMASNYYKLSYFCYLMERSCLFTLAVKHKCSARQIISKYKDEDGWSVPYKTKKLEKRVAIIKFKTYEPYKPSDAIDEYQFYGWKTTIWRRMKRGVCEFCKVPMEGKGIVHVVKKLKGLGKKPWEKVMKKMRRKTLIVCPQCHMLIHASG